MLDLNPVKKLHRIKGNEPLLLNDPHQVWIVKSGAIAVFAGKIQSEKPAGNRHYMFGVGAGEALFGAATPPNQGGHGGTAPTRGGENLKPGWGLLAIAIAETELEPIAIADCAALVAAGDSKTRSLVEGWIQHLGERVIPYGIDALHAPDEKVAPETVVLAASQQISLLPGQILRSPPGTVVWVRVSSGDASVGELQLNSASPAFPLAGNILLVASGEVEVQIFSTAEVENADWLPASLALLHEYFCCCLNLLVSQQKAEEFRRFQEREQLNRQVTQTALGDLTEVLHPRKTALSEEGTPLLIAAGAVGKAQSITVNPPAGSEDLSRVKDPMEAIARSSQFRTRHVLLAGDWWRQNCGPLLAYTKSENRPVALLPGKGSRYTLFDPIDRTRKRVTKAIAQELSSETLMFYRPLPLLLHNAAELFRFGTKGYEKDIIVAFGLGILGTLLGMVTPQATSILVNDAIPDSDRLLLWQLGLVLLVAAIGRAVFSMAQTILTLRIENAASGTLQPAVWDRLLRLKSAFFRSYSSGDLLTRLLAVNQIRAQLSGATQRTLLNAIFSLLNLGLMFIYSLPLALVGIGLTLIAVIVTVTSSLLLIPKERQMETGEGDINGLTVELINGVSKLRVAAAEGRAFAAWAKKYSQQIKLRTGIKRIDDSVSVFNEALPLVSSILMFWFAIQFMENPKTGGDVLNMGTFLAFNSAFGTFLSGITDLSNTVTDILGIVPLWERAKPIVQGIPESDPTKADPGRLKGQITIDRATFRYREDGPPILDDVSINIQPGEFIAIVGPSGSGKSTLFRLLLGFEIAQSGTVYYDNQDLAGLDVQAVRRQLGVVLQNGRINAGSMFDNITCGAMVTQEEAWEAAQMAGLAADIEQMPMGMHTVVSEGGTNLSGGQRQRLLIARAMVVKPKVILMDEATSALDNHTQAIVTESLDKLNVTRVVIAHRLSTIRNADRIYVIEAGRLVEFGSFEELVKQGGLFARLVARQIE
ncbi:MULTISPECIES: NHLP bacteriocin export ABC transporter permease/ATPase subunit [unclassified Microcoleus]|uniref:NHLP bacteriocin export ABC transporter permease/ATPase subunit n=1 Tax=unclassified Microcoleus TaxID=2642155 RepID=UPI002FD25B3E